MNNNKKVDALIEKLTRDIEAAESFCSMHPFLDEMVGELLSEVKRSLEIIPFVGKTRKELPEWVDPREVRTIYKVTMDINVIDEWHLYDGINWLQSAEKELNINYADHLRELEEEERRLDNMDDYQDDLPF